MADEFIPARIEITRDKLELIKNTICKGATDNELALFKYICEKRQLDPFARQIYAIKRKQWNSETNGYDLVMTIQTGIDGFRLTAERSHKYAGQLGPFWTKDGINWLDAWVEDTPPKAAKVAVIRSDFREPLWAMARFQAYCPRNQKGDSTGLWKTNPEGQIAKCAEALAFRRAFPEELSGLYTSDEMHQATDAVDMRIKDVGTLSPEETPRAKESESQTLHTSTSATSSRSEASAQVLRVVPDADPIVEEEVIDDPDDIGGEPANADPNRLVTEEEAKLAKKLYDEHPAKASDKTNAIRKLIPFTKYSALTRGQLDTMMQVLESLR